MVEKILLLVCEGETDIYIFEALAEYFSNSSTKLTFKSLAPQRDATSGTYPNHSFGHVINWCSTNRSRIQMLIDFQGASALFLQMDTDIAKQINVNCITSGYSARRCCEEKLNLQFKSSAEPARCHYILPTQNTETWILASHESSELDENNMEISDYELIIDTEKRLIDRGYKSRKGKNKATRKLNKTPAKKYKEYGKQLTDYLAIARQRCSELDRFCILLDKQSN